MLISLVYSFDENTHILLDGPSSILWIYIYIYIFAGSSRFANEDGEEEYMAFKFEKDISSIPKARSLGVKLPRAAASVDVPLFYAEGLQVCGIFRSMFFLFFLRGKMGGRAGGGGADVAWDSPHS